MRIKTKLYIGLIFLFAELLIVSALGIYSTYNMSMHVKMMVADNIRSVQYSEAMLSTIDEINEAATVPVSHSQKNAENKSIQKNIDLFESEMHNEELNITEIGEKELIISLRKKFSRYKLALQEPGKNSIAVYSAKQRVLYNAIRTDILNISKINTQAILRKNASVSASANKFYILISFIATAFLLGSFSFIYNFPKDIAGPISDFTKSIREISKHNYRQRLHHRSNDEFGELADAFNTMAKKIEEFESKKKVKVTKNSNSSGKVNRKKS